MIILFRSSSFLSCFTSFPSFLSLSPCSYSLVFLPFFNLSFYFFIFLSLFCCLSPPSSFLLLSFLSCFPSFHSFRFFVLLFFPLPSFHSLSFPTFFIFYLCYYLFCPVFFLFIPLFLCFTVFSPSLFSFFVFSVLFFFVSIYPFL